MMKIPFRRDTSAERRKTLEATSSAAATLASLRAERQAALLDSGLEEIEKHDNAIAAQERRIATLQEKLRLLTDEQKRERDDQREADRQTAIKVIESKLKKREALATELEAAIAAVEECYFALVEFLSITGDWPRYGARLWQNRPSRHSERNGLGHVLRWQTRWRALPPASRRVFGFGRERHSAGRHRRPGRQRKPADHRKPADRLAWS
jgi:hypothetical protein